MRQEEKEVDGPDLEKAEERKRETELVEEKDDEVRDLDGKPYEMEGERDKERSGTVVSAMRRILEREQIVINDINLSPRELKALEALQTAVRGRDGALDRFVYAEDRRALLEQALAVLQPDIVSLEREAGQPFEDLMKEVSGLRDKLNVLEDAEETMPQHAQDEAKGETDSDDKPDDDDQSLTGPERKVETKKSVLGEGPELKDEKKEPSTLTTGPDVKAEKQAASTLAAGPELKDEKKPDTSLGDPKEIAETERQNQPFWRSSRG